MVTITCDVCKRVKQKYEERLLGFDPDVDAPYAVRCSPTFLVQWIQSAFLTLARFISAPKTANRNTCARQTLPKPIVVNV